MSVQSLSIPVSWAISQYRQVLAGIATRGRALNKSVKIPSDPPEIVAYWRAIGVGRHIDAYA